MKDPNLDIKMELFPKYVVEAVDSLILYANKNKAYSPIVESPVDWKIIEGIYRLFSIMYPNTEKEFIKSIKHFKTTEVNKGIAREGEGMIQHQLEVPQPLYQMINSFFPQQKWDKQFVKEISQVLPQLKTNDAKL